MVSDPYGGLFWNSRAGVLVQAIDQATKSERSHRKHESAFKAPRSLKSKFNDTNRSFPKPVAAVGLVLVGSIMGAALAVTLSA